MVMHTSEMNLKSGDVTITTISGRQVTLSGFEWKDADKLSEYYDQLSEVSKKRYGPHRFDKQSIIDLYGKGGSHLGYIAREVGSPAIIAYAIVRLGYLEHDLKRLKSYGLNMNVETDSVYAPSVADAWQSCGVGNSMFLYILEHLKRIGITRIILWGGVQADNEKAVGFYKKHGFQTLGEFEHNGINLDMMLEIK
jgi:ribosomal protein S18 acetylase RimI-like enzyme